MTAATGFCLFGFGLPAAQAADTTTAPSLVRAAKSAPWKNAMTRGIRPASPAVAPAVVTAPVATVVDPAASFAAKIITLVNIERAQVGLAPLAVSSCAGGFATTWSKTMAATGSFEHQSLSPIMTSCAARGAGENIAYGASTPEQFMSMWMNSAGHKANILRASFTHIGVGVAKNANGTWYATQSFLTK